MLRIENSLMTLTLDTNNASLSLLDRRNRACYSTEPLDCTISEISSANAHSLSFRICIGEDSADVMCSLQEARLSITITGQGTLHAPFAFPGAWCAEAGDEILYPLGEGIVLPVEEVPTFPKTLYYANGSHLSLGMWGLLRGEGGMFFAVQEMADAALVWHADAAGRTCHAVQCLSSKGEWAYPRNFEVFVAHSDAFNSLCHAYRAWRMAQGMVVPLTKKAEHAPRISYWYWGDSSNCCPELMQLRDQFNALYAVPPLYSLNMSQWDQLKEEIAASYHRATPAARHTAFSPMVRFEYLTQDRLVQRTLFENGLEVVANFSGDTYDGIAPGECCIQTQDGSVIASF